MKVLKIQRKNLLNMKMVVIYLNFAFFIEVKAKYTYRILNFVFQFIKNTKWHFGYMDCLALLAKPGWFSMGTTNLYINAAEKSFKISKSTSFLSNFLVRQVHQKFNGTSKSDCQWNYWVFKKSNHKIISENLSSSLCVNWDFINISLICQLVKWQT